MELFQHFIGEGSLLFFFKKKHGKQLFAVDFCDRMNLVTFDPNSQS